MSTRIAWGLDSPRTDNPLTWVTRAACRLDPDLFWAGNSLEDGMARHVCLRHCPVLDQCLAQARDTRPYECVQGGFVWVRVKNAQVGRPGIQQPLAAGCGKFCEPWRQEAS